jgi:hypothetical protein
VQRIFICSRLRQAQSEPLAPIDLISCLVSDELARRGERLLERRKASQFRDAQKTLDNFDFNFNRKMNGSLVFDLAPGTFIGRHEDTLVFRRARHWQEPLGASHRAGCHPGGI